MLVVALRAVVRVINLIVVGVLYLSFCLVVRMVVVVVFWYFDGIVGAGFFLCGDNGILLVWMVMAAVREVVVISSNYLYVCLVVRSLHNKSHTFLWYL